MLTGTNAYALDLDTYRHLEIKIRKESELGSGLIRFRKDGNSVATFGQSGSFSIQNANPANISTEVNTIILDMHQIAAWTDGDMTGLALQLHEGQGTSVVGTTDYLYSVRLATDITDTDPGNLVLILEHSVDLQSWEPISITPGALNQAGAVIRQGDEGGEFFRLRIEPNTP